MYSAKISNSMTIDKKTGEAKLNDIQVRVDNFTEPEILSKTVKAYNTGKDLPKQSYNKKGWPENDWHEIYYDFLTRLLKWRKRA